MIIGQKITYMCLAGFLYEAVVRTINRDGTVDIGSDVGSTDLHELTRIEVCSASTLRRGTCCDDTGKATAWRLAAQRAPQPQQLAFW